MVDAVTRGIVILGILVWFASVVMLFIYFAIMLMQLYFSAPSLAVGVVAIIAMMWGMLMWRS